MRRNGYALDSGEQEIGVRCVAVAVPTTATPLALSVSGPASRLSNAVLPHVSRVLTAAAESLAQDLAA